MRRPRLIASLVLVSVLALVAAACGGGGTEPSGGGSSGAATGAANDLLSQVMESGKLRVSTDPQYPPQSSYDETTGTWEGFDIDVATEIAKRMGVEIEWKTPSWNTITSGNWAGRWDLSVGSMTVTKERARVLNFSVPYYYTPAAVAVANDSSTTTVEQLSGKKIGVCQACTYDFYLQKNLEIPGQTQNYVIDNAQIQTYPTDQLAVKDLELGDGVRLDAVMSSITLLQGAIDKGSPIKIIGEPVFYEPLAAATDKSSELDTTSFDQKLNDIIKQMHSDGTLTQLSNKWFGQDLTMKTGM